MTPTINPATLFWHIIRNTADVEPAAEERSQFRAPPANAKGQVNTGDVLLNGQDKRLEQRGAGLRSTHYKFTRFHQTSRVTPAMEV